MAEAKQNFEAQNEQLSGLRKEHSPNLLFFIARSKNANIVVYEAILKNGKFDANKPFEVFWLDIDPEFVKKNRAKGINTDRSDLNMIEKQFAYGISWELIANEKDAYKLKLVALSERPVTVRIVDGKPIAKLQINGVQSRVERVYVHSKERMLGLPKVEYVDVEGVDDAGKPVKERIDYGK